jgi:hypothetical protein
MRRDTVMVPAGGYIVLRYTADNPDKLSPLSYGRPPTLTLLLTRRDLPLPYRVSRLCRAHRNHHRGTRPAAGLWHHHPSRPLRCLQRPAYSYPG